MFFGVYQENCEAESAGCSTQNLSHEGQQTLRVTPHKHNVQLEITRECAANFENERRPTNMNCFLPPWKCQVSHPATGNALQVTAAARTTVEAEAPSRSDAGLPPYSVHPAGQMFFLSLFGYTATIETAQWR